jgi:hypothetical protein
LALLVVCGLGAAFVGSIAVIAVARGRPAEVTALEASAAGPPRYVYGSDGRTHVDYDLVITNAFTAEATLKSLTVRGDGKRLLRLTGGTLAAHTHTIIPTAPTDRVPASATVVTVVDVALPRSAGRRAPTRLSNAIHYTLPAGAKLRAGIGSTTVNGPILPTTRRAPVVIAPPLRGTGWLAGNGCCDPSSAHRSLLLSASGTYVTPEMFALDWTKVVNGALFRGNGSQLSDYFAFGASVHAVANGTVVETMINRPEAPLNESATGNPTVKKSQDFGGNHVIEKIGPGLYAAYEHLQTGSVMVKPGQRLRTGEPIAKLGNTGNTQLPHLHFGIQDTPDILTSNSLPFEIDHYAVQGISPASTRTHIVLAGHPHHKSRSYPLVPAVSAFAANPPAG